MVEIKGGISLKNIKTLKDKRNLILILILVIIIAFACYICSNKNLFNNVSKNIKLGNTTSSQEIIEYVLNISSYEAIIEAKIESNKNENRYVIKQQFVGPNTYVQEILEPTNIEGIKLIQEGNKVTLKNTKMNLTTVFENYEYISTNDLDLKTFLEEYKENETANMEEDEDTIKLTMKVSKSQTKVEKKIYIDKKTIKPSKMDIKYDNQSTNIYILYKEVEIDSLKRENMIAFEINKNFLEI